MTATEPSWPAWLALALYWLWTIAGRLDFVCHRRTNLSSTSGLAESRLHLVQLVLMGAGTVLVLWLQATAALAVVLLAVVIAHAVAGYRDTRNAFEAGRTILPVEQHLHSILDIAPWVAWAAVAWRAASAPSIDWTLSVRSPAIAWTTWAMVLVPAAVLCVWPALIEYRASWRVARERHRA